MILKAMFWQLMDRDNRIRIPHPLPKRKPTPFGVGFSFCHRIRDSNPSKCNSPVDCCLPPASTAATHKLTRIPHPTLFKAPWILQIQGVRFVFINFIDNDILLIFLKQFRIISENSPH